MAGGLDTGGTSIPTPSRTAPIRFARYPPLDEASGTRSKVAKKDRGDRTKAKQVRWLGKRLDVEFNMHVATGPASETGDLAEVGRDAWVAVEIESRQTHPVENVLRYWPWLDRNRRRLVLVHVIPPRMRKRDGTRAELTKWLGALMERVLPGRFTYCRLELGSRTEKRQLEDVIGAVAELRQPRVTRSPAAGL